MWKVWPTESFSFEAGLMPPSAARWSSHWWGPKQIGIWAGGILRDSGSLTSSSPLLNTTCSDEIGVFWL